MEKNRYLVPISAEHAVQGRVGKSVVLTGENLQLAIVYLEPGSEIPWHSHPNEAMVTLIQGSYEMWIGEERLKLEPGWAAWIPSNVPHRAVIGDELTVEVEAFSPPREEYADRNPASDFRKTSEP